MEVASGTDVDAVTIRLRRAGGSFAWFEVNGSAVRDDEGELRFLLGTARDVSEREELRWRLRDLDAVYRFADAVAGARALDEVLEAALDALLEATGADRAAVLLADDDGVLRFRAWRGLSDRYRAFTEGRSPWPPDDEDPQPGPRRGRRRRGLRARARTRHAQGGHRGARLHPARPRRAAAREVHALPRRAAPVERPRGAPLADDRESPRLGRRAGAGAAGAARVERAAREHPADGRGRDHGDEPRRPLPVRERRRGARTSGSSPATSSLRSLRASGPRSTRCSTATARGWRSRTCRPRRRWAAPRARRSSGSAPGRRTGSTGSRCARRRSSRADGSVELVVNVTRDITQETVAAQREADARREAEGSRARLALLLEATEQLSQTLDYEELLRRVPQLVVPRIADGCHVYIARDEDTELVRVAHAHVEPRIAALLDKIDAVYDVSRHRRIPVVEVFRTGKPIHRPALARPLQKVARPGEEELVQMESRSLIVVPLETGAQAARRACRHLDRAGPARATRTSSSSRSSRAASPSRSISSTSTVGRRTPSRSCRR